MVRVLAGEILLTSIDRDGSLDGYDLGVLKEVVGAVNVPVIINGGCGDWSHMAEAIRAGASGVATSNIHHLTDRAIVGFKNALVQYGVNVRPSV
jgi:cyclase